MNYLRRGRPRRDQWASPHERARTLAAERLDEPLAPTDSEWLERHLEECGPCAVVAADYAMQRLAFRELAARQPEPPRDLWARTAAAIEQEAARTGGARAQRGVGRPSPIPIGILSGALVVAVVVGVSLVSRDRPLTPPPLTPPPSGSPAPSFEPAATPLVVPAGEVAWLRQREDGSYGLYVAEIDQVCPGRDKEGCAPIDDAQLQALANIEHPSAVVLSPSTDQLVLVDSAGGDAGGTVYVVPVATPVDPNASPSPTVSPTEPDTQPPSGTPVPSPSPAPSGATAIATGVVLVGDSAAYSPDGQWFAFSALPADGSHGPDIYVWHVGDALARQVTSDHRSVFAAWFGGHLLGSRVIDPDAPPEPGPSGSPGATSPSPSPTPTPSAPSGAPGASGSPVPPSAPRDDLTAETFLIDPTTGEEILFADVAVWRPTVDPSARWAVYWEGTLASNEGNTAWEPSAGRLVLGPWPIPLPAEPVDPSASALPSASAGAGASPSPSPSASATPGGSASPTVPPTPNPSAASGDVDGPVQVLEARRVVDWDARWDPTGTRLAIWVADDADPSIGRLSLFVVDPETGRFDPSSRILRDQPALAGFSLTDGLLAWATPPGQDGEGSRVQVLAWSGDAFGSVETTPGSDPVLIIR